MRALISSYEWSIDAVQAARRLRAFLLHPIYALLQYLIRDAPVEFLNLGYLEQEENHEGLRLLPEDEANRAYIQLYERTVNGIQMGGRDVLEVSCGRGGGASYVMRYLHPQTLLGVDRTARAVAFCRRRHRLKGLQFQGGDALALPLEADSYDVILNVEASHGYVDCGIFLREAFRVLRPGGVLALADFRRVAELGQFRAEIAQSGLILQTEEDITQAVVRAIEAEDEVRRGLIERFSPRPLRWFFGEFAGLKDSYIHTDLASGRRRYLRVVLRNPE